MIIHNVTDRRYGWIGSWEAEPLIISRLISSDRGRTVIYVDHGRAEAGTLWSWDGKTVWAGFHQGDTRAACSPENLFLASKALDGNKDRI